MKPKTYIEKNYKNQKKQLKICYELLNFFLSDEDIIRYLEIKGLSPQIPTKEPNTRKIVVGKKKVSRNGSNRA